MHLLKGISIGVAVLAIGFCGGWRVVADSAATQIEPELSPSERVVDVTPGLVGVQGAGGLGSGIVVDPNGLVLTSSHLVSGADSAYVRTFKGDSARGAVLMRDVATGLALVQLPVRSLPVVWNATGNAARGGDRVELAAYQPRKGEQWGIGFVLNTPVQHARLRVYPVVPRAADRMLPLGSVAVGERGTVIGMITVKTNSDHAWSAVALDTAFQSVLSSWVQDLPRSRLDVVATTVTPVLVEAFKVGRVSGVLVQEDATPAGLKAGDIVFRLDDTVHVRDVDDMQKALQRIPPNRSVALRVRRGAKDTTVMETTSAFRQ